MDRHTINQQNAKLLRVLGIKHSKQPHEINKPTIKPGHVEDLPSTDSVGTSDSSLLEMRQMDEMFEEWWQNRGITSN